MTRPTSPRTDTSADRGAGPARPRPDRPRLLLGAYALAPSGSSAEAGVLAALPELGVQALEVPLPAPGTAAETARWVATHLPDDVDLVVTAIPRTMQRLADDPAYGLSSSDLDARRAALDDLAELRDLAQRLSDDAGRPRLTAVELHSAPGPGLGTLAAFRESLDEVLAWDLGGARLVVEHCDALVDGQQAVKGFWPLHDELTVLQSLAGDVPEVASRLGVSVNWGRSAIEGRSARTPVEHVRAAAEAGLLRAVVFSGAAASPTPWGAAWEDQHIAPRGDDPALGLSEGSLLGAEEIAETLAAARGTALDVVGIKVTVRPDTADAQDRVAVARASLRLVTEALEHEAVLT